MRVLSWYENLPEEEVPPRAIWFDSRRMKAWFEEIKRKRKSKYEDGEEAPEGTMEEARQGRHVTLRNRIAMQMQSAAELSEQLYDYDPLA